MSYDAIHLISVFFAVLALAAAAGAVTLIASKRARAVIDPNTALVLITCVAVTMMAGSLFYSEVAGFLPCKLCWVQRGFAYPGALWALYATARKKLNQWWVAALVGFGGLPVSIWHYLIQNFPELEKAGGACDPRNPCSAAYLDTFGFITIPFMAGCGFLAIGVLALVWRRGLGKAAGDAGEEEADGKTQS